MKAFILKQEDIDRLILMLERDPERGGPGAKTETERRIYTEAFRFYNYNVRKWISEVTS